MRKIIDGRIYDTVTATEICYVGNAGQPGTEEYNLDDTVLYRSPKGVFFICGFSGGDGRWGRPGYGSDRRSGEGLSVIDEAEARRLVEKYANAET